MTGPARLFGCGTALVTPFRADGELDEAALRAFLEWQIAEGVHFLVPCGSTGEAATMTLAEHRRVVEITAEVARGRSLKGLFPVAGEEAKRDYEAWKKRGGKG